MAALTALRNTRQQGLPSEPILPSVDVRLKANAKVFRGGMVARDSSGYGVAALTATGLIVVGVADPHQSATSVVDNTGGANGAKSVRVAQGCFWFNNSSAGDLIAETEIGKRVYAVDDQTVAKTSGTSTRSPAGIVVDVDSTGVCVSIVEQLAAMLPP